MRRTDALSEKHKIDAKRHNKSLTNGEISVKHRMNAERLKKPNFTMKPKYAKTQMQRYNDYKTRWKQKKRMIQIHLNTSEQAK